MRLILLLLTLITSAQAEQVLSQNDYDALRANLQVIPLILPDEPIDLSRGGPAERSAGIMASNDLRADYPKNQLRGLLFPQWRRFAGEGVSLDIPDHPQISVVRAKPRFPNPLNLQADDDNTDDNIANGYHLLFADQILVSVIIEQSNSLDNSPGCFCGAIALNIFRFRDGVMRRFSLMENGETKSIETAVKQHSARLTEWTHSLLHPDVYTRIGLSLTPHGELFTREAAQTVVINTQDMNQRQAMVINNQDMNRRVGLLYPGMSRDAVIEVMGKPFTEADNRLRWRWVPSPTPPTLFYQTMEVELDEFGLFQGWLYENVVLPDSHESDNETNKSYGSVPWILSHIPTSRHRESEQSFLEKWTKRLLPTLSVNDGNLLLNRLDRVTEDGNLRVSPDVMLLVQNFFIQHGGGTAAWLLQHQIPATAPPLFIAQLNVLLTTPANEQAHESIPLLMSFIGNKNPEYTNLARAIMTHATPSIQRYGWTYTEHLDLAVINSQLPTAIVSPDYWTRFNVAEYLCKQPRQPESILALVRTQKDKENEKDVWLLDAWDQVLTMDQQPTK